MTVERTADQEGPASLTVFFASSTSAAPLNPAQSTSGDKTMSKDSAPVESTKSINMKHKHEDEILEELMSLTSGQVVRATPEEQALMKELEEQRKRSEADRVRQAGVLAAKKRQQEVLAAARASVGEVSGAL